MGFLSSLNVNVFVLTLFCCVINIYGWMDIRISSTVQLKHNFENFSRFVESKCLPVLSSEPTQSLILSFGKRELIIDYLVSISV